MRLNQLEYVIEISKSHSFSKASQKLFIAQSALSKSIASLEEELGVTIFYRTPKGVFLTDDGEKIVAQANYILSAMEQITNIANDSQLSSVVTIAATPEACNGVTTDLLKHCSVAYPELQLNFIELRPAKILKTLVDGTADIAIGHYASDREAWYLDEARKSNLHVEPLMTDSFCVFVSSEHPMAQKEILSLHELGQERRAVFQDYMFTWDEEEQPEEQEAVSKYYAFSDRSGIKQAVAAGVAYTIFPYQMALDDIYVDTGRIKMIPLADSETEITTYVAWRKNTYVSKAELVVLDYIRKLYAEVAERLRHLYVC